jgi:hypothetical protein
MLMCLNLYKVSLEEVTSIMKRELLSIWMGNPITDNRSN